MRKIQLLVALFAVSVLGTGCATTVLKQGNLDCGKSEVVYENPTSVAKEVKVKLDSKCGSDAYVRSVRQERRLHVMWTGSLPQPIEKEIPVTPGGSVEVQGGDFTVTE